MAKVAKAFTLLTFAGKTSEQGAQDIGQVLVLDALLIKLAQTGAAV